MGDRTKTFEPPGIRWPLTTDCHRQIGRMQLSPVASSEIDVSRPAVPASCSVGVRRRGAWSCRFGGANTLGGGRSRPVRMMPLSFIASSIQVPQNYQRTRTKRTASRRMFQQEIR